MGEAKRRKMAGDMPTELKPKPQRQRVTIKRIDYMDYAAWSALAFPMLAAMMVRKRPKAIDSTAIHKPKEG